MLLIISKGVNYYCFNQLMDIRLDLECFQLLCTGNICKMKTYIEINVVMVLNKDTEMIKQLLAFCSC